MATSHDEDVVATIDSLFQVLDDASQEGYLAPANNVTGVKAK